MMFTKEASDLEGFPERLPEHLIPHEESFVNFREHFRLALACHVAGGDIRRDISSDRVTVNQLQKDVGVSRKNPPDEANYKRHTADWKTKAGLEVLSIMWPLERLP